MSDNARVLDDVLRGAGLLDLGDAPSLEAVDAALCRLHTAVNGDSKLNRSLLREGAISALREAGINAPARVVDAALEPETTKLKSTQDKKSLALTDADPWPNPVDGDALLEELVRTISRFVALPDGGAIAVALWILHAHAHDAADLSPVLGITSPEKRCGKTTLLQVLRALVPRPLPASNITPAALFRAVEKYGPTLLVDEADTFLREREELRGVLNSGHARSSAVVVRAVAAGDDYDVRKFSTWAPKALALIGELPDTLADRSIELRMRRRAPGEEVEPLRLDRLDELEPIRRRARRWAEDNADELRMADPQVPAGLHDRASDNWRHLLAIADLAGGGWPEQARQASLVLSGACGRGGESDGVRLLQDLHDLFAARSADRLPSREIVKALATMEERPWPEWKGGNPITPRQLAAELRRFEIGPKKIRVGDSTLRGYVRDEFEDAFRRYLSAPTPLSDPEHPEQAPNDGRNSGSANRNTRGHVPDPGSTESSTEPGDVPDVPDPDPRSGEERGQVQGDGAFGSPDLDVWTGGPKEPEQEKGREDDGVPGVRRGIEL